MDAKFYFLMFSELKMDYSFSACLSTHGIIYINILKMPQKFIYVFQAYFTKFLLFSN